MSETSESIPLLMAIEFLKHHDDDRMEHLLRVGVVGVKEPMTAEIESDFYEHPRIKDLWTSGGVDLPAHVEEKLLIKCFESLWPSLDGTDIAQDVLSDATPWLSTMFSPEETEIVLTELRRHVTPGLVVNYATCSAFLRVSLSTGKGDQE